MTDTAPDTEFVPIAEVEIEMTAGELRAALAAHQPAHDVAKLVERLRHPVAEHWLKDAADAANLIDRQRAEIERLTKERDEAYRKGQEDMRGRAAKVCFQTRGSTIAGTRIRALKIKGAPDAE